MMRGYARYRSVVTSTGEIRVRSIARSKKRRAASLFRRGERKTSMTWPELVDGPEQVAPGPAHPRVRLVDVPAITHHVPTCPSRLGELGGEPLDPPVDAHVVDLDPPLGEELLDVPVGQAEPHVPPDRQGDDLAREAVSGEG